MYGTILFIIMLVILIGIVALQHKIYNKGGLYKFWIILFWLSSIPIFKLSKEYGIYVLISAIFGMLAVFFTRNSKKEIDNNNVDVTLVNMIKEEHIHLH